MTELEAIYGPSPTAPPSLARRALETFVMAAVYAGLGVLALGAHCLTAY